MKILSIDTSSKICSVAILENTTLIKEISINNGYTHSEILMPTIKQILEETNLKLTDINLLVVDKGPGSFTGIRIGIATVKGFTDSLNIPTIGISSLETLAYNQKENKVICSLIDAKNGHVYSGIFENINGNNVERRKLSFDDIDDLLEELKNLNLEYSICFVGDGAICNKELIISKLPNSTFCLTNDVSAYNLGLAGLNKFTSNGADKDILPLYLRKPQAERMLENKNEK